MPEYALVLNEDEMSDLYGIVYDAAVEHEYPFNVRKNYKKLFYKVARCFSKMDDRDCEAVLQQLAGLAKQGLHPGEFGPTIEGLVEDWNEEDTRRFV